MQRLNSTGVLTQRGGSRWFHSTVRGIATNAAYRPHPDDPRRQGARLAQRCGAVSAQWPPLTTRQAFEAAGAVLGADGEKVREIRRDSPPGVIKYLLSGSACGAATRNVRIRRCPDSATPPGDRCQPMDARRAELLRARRCPKPTSTSPGSSSPRLSKKDARHLRVAGKRSQPAPQQEELARLRAEAQRSTSLIRHARRRSAAASMAAKEAAMAPRDRRCRTPIACRRHSARRTASIIAAARLGEDRVRPMWDSLPLPARRDIVAGLFIRLTLSPASGPASPAGPHQRSG